MELKAQLKACPSERIGAVPEQAANWAMWDARRHVHKSDGAKALCKGE